MTAQASSFELVTWYDTWNQLGLQNLIDQKVPLVYATRYNLAFGSLVAAPSGGYTVEMTGKYAAEVNQQISSQAPSVVIYAGLGSDGIVDAVKDNAQNNNRSTANIVAWLQANNYKGISIDAEDFTVMKSVPELVTQLGPDFRAAGLGIAVSAPWPGDGPEMLYGPDAVAAFNENVQAIEMQDYSSISTPNSAPTWIKAGIKTEILMGGVCTENSGVQTPLSEVTTWTQYAMNNGLGGMFSWRLDNDHGTDGEHEDVNPTFTGARTVYDTATGG